MKLGLILGDQLSQSLATIKSLNKESDALLLAEVHEEASYVSHHKQKIALVFSAMRHFAAELEDAGWRVHYQAYGEHQHQSLLAAVQAQIQTSQATELVITHSGEYRLQAAIAQQWAAELACPINCLDDDRFISSPAEFSAWAQGRKQLTMEYFYREMRRKTGLLMDDDEPVGGQWNFDAKNREPYKGDTPLPEPPSRELDKIDQAVLALVEKEFADHLGQLDGFSWATSRAGALQCLETFIELRLPHFGRYQDAMVTGEDFLYHSLLSPYLNCGLLLPMEVCLAAEQAYADGHAPLNAVEGFIRQIIGWREYVRGIYWQQMPDYAEKNYLQSETKLPAYYWSGNTKMHCMSEAFRATFTHGYAHHIQRLMITGNFALLADIKPSELCDWYLMVYVDAYDWVELPNTLGMVLHADEGLLGSKPYAASGNYINKMSDYCKHCSYNVKTTTEADSCPFNSLYWHFIARHETRFKNNHRMRMIYASLGKMNADKRRATLAKGGELLANLDQL